MIPNAPSPSIRTVEGSGTAAGVSDFGAATDDVAAVSGCGVEIAGADSARWESPHCNTNVEGTFELAVAAGAVTEMRSVEIAQSVKIETRTAFIVQHVVRVCPAQTGRLVDGIGIGFIIREKQQHLASTRFSRQLWGDEKNVKDFMTVCSFSGNAHAIHTYTAKER